jgi:hypothetical protein
VTLHPQQGDPAERLVAQGRKQATALGGDHRGDYIA